MKHKLMLNIPSQFETERLLVRAYRAGDGVWYTPMIEKNREHLFPYEAGNIGLTATDEEKAEILMRDLAAEFVARNSFFMGAFDQQTETFVAQLYIGAINWELPEFVVGFFVDNDHEGQGYVTEMVQGALGFIFEHLHAHRVRLYCADSNERSLRVAERCGFIKEAHLREDKRFPDGTVHGTLIYGLLKDEFSGRA
jgi:[ribosomal protein S5]-alanine N-acetyltransferase